MPFVGWMQRQDLLGRERVEMTLIRRSIWLRLHRACKGSPYSETFPESHTGGLLRPEAARTSQSGRASLQSPDGIFTSFEMVKQ